MELVNGVADVLVAELDIAWWWGSHGVDRMIHHGWTEQRHKIVRGGEMCSATLVG
jgi:hypothetical protein